MEELSSNYPAPHPDASSAYGHAWDVIKNNFLELLLLSILLIVIEIPSSLAYQEELLNMDEFYTMASMASLQYPIGYAILYNVLIATPLEYGILFLFVQAVKGEKIDFKQIIYPFNRIIDVVLSRVFVFFIVGIGVVFLIIPGIIFAVRLAFVPYLVVEKDMDAMSAVKESWNLTRGNVGMSVFLAAILAIFIFLAGIIAFGVGVIFSTMWVYAAFASLYYGAQAQKSMV